MSKACEKRLCFAVEALILHEGQFLAMHLSGDSNADLPDLLGGRMEFGETAEETVIRADGIGMDLFNRTDCRARE